jgi:hypothetical protein
MHLPAPQHLFICPYTIVCIDLDQGRWGHVGAAKDFKTAAFCAENEGFRGRSVTSVQQRSARSQALDLGGIVGLLRPA